MEGLAIHELAHALGFANNSLSVPTDIGGNFLLNAAASGVNNTPFTNLLQNVDIVNNRGDFAGANARAVYGTAGNPVSVPVQVGDTHTLLPFHTMTRGRSFSPNGGGIADYRNSPAFLPVELAIMRDLGYNINLADHFGEAYYQRNVIANTGASAPIADFGIGVYIQSVGSSISVNGNQVITGDFGTGVRINGGQEGVIQNGTLLVPASTEGNTVTINSGVTVSANGVGGIGILQSAGANNRLMHRGAITATGTDGRGIVVDFGSDNLFTAIDSNFYQLPALSRIDISGSITATGNAIEIDNSAAVDEINFMSGVAIDGGIESNAQIGTGASRPLFTFGRLADASGAATNAVDAAFAFNYDGNIFGSTRPTGELRGGVTEFDGNVSFNTLQVDAGATLGGTGTVNSSFGAQNNGTIAPGNGNIGTLRLNGGLVNNGTIEVEIRADGTTPGVDSDLLIVTGQTNLNGGTVDIHGVPGNYIAGSEYTFLQSTLIVENTTPTFTEDIADRRIIALLGATDYRFLIARDVPFGQIGITPNQISFGDYLQGVIDNGGLPDLRNLLDLIPTEEGVQQAFDQLTGSIYGTGVATIGHSTSAFLDRLGTNLDANVKSSDCCCGSRRGRTVWNHSYGWGGSIEDDGNAYGVNTSAAGTAIGITKTWDDGAFTGMFYGFESLDASSQEFGSRFDSQIHRLGMYAQIQEGNQHLRLIGYGGFGESKTARTVAIGNGTSAISERNRGGNDVWTAGVDIEAGATNWYGPLRVQAISGLRYIHTTQSGFMETGGMVSNLIFDDAHFDILRARLGIATRARLLSGCPLM